MVDAERVLADVDECCRGGAGALGAEESGMNARVLAPSVQEGGEEEIETTLRPGSLAEFVGQERVKEAARDRTRRRPRAWRGARPRPAGRPAGLVRLARADHPPGVGVSIRQVAGPALERKGDIAAILTCARTARRALRRRDPPAQPVR